MFVVDTAFLCCFVVFLMLLLFLCVVISGERVEIVQRQPQDRGEETQGWTGVSAEGPEEGCVSSAKRREVHSAS